MKAINHNWPNDPNVKREGNGGRAPDGHTRRCQGRNAYLTEREGKPIQCGRWALIGRTYCARCGGKQPQHKLKVAARRWYSKHSGVALKARLDEMANAPPDERISLESEIDVARVLAVESIACFDKICVQGNTGTAEGAAAQIMKAQATIAARDAMTFVANIIDKAAKVRASSQGTIDVELIGYLIHQVQAIIERHIVSIPKIGKTLCDKITEDLNNIRMPDRQHAETSADDRAANVRNIMAEMDLSVTGVRPGKNGHAT